MSLISGIKKASFYDPATGTVVQCNNLAAEGEFKKDGLGTKNAKGAEVFSGNDSLLELTSYDIAGSSQLETWMKNKTPIRAAVYGVQDNIVWNESVPIQVKSNYNIATGSRNSIVITMSRKGGEHNIYHGKNLLFLLKGWEDADSDTIVDNYVFQGSGDTNHSFSSQQQSVSYRDEDITVDINASIQFPIANAKLQFSQNVTGEVQINTDAKVRFLNFNNNEIGAEYIAFDQIGEITSPANTYSIEVHLINSTLFQSGYRATIDNPYLGAVLGSHETIRY